MTTLAEAQKLGTPLVERTVRRTVPCRQCAHPLDRTAVLRRTQNLYARRPKTIEALCAELRAEAETWHPADDICDLCAEFPDVPTIPTEPNQNVRIS